MEKYVKSCAGQAGYSLVFDQSVVNYRENFNKIGDVPFSIYYDFETTTGSAIYTDAKMHVVSYCMIVAFHAELKMPPLAIYRASDQSLPQLRSLHYLDQVKKIFCLTAITTPKLNSSLTIVLSPFSTNRKAPSCRNCFL